MSAIDPPPILEVRDLKKHFPIKRRTFAPRGEQQRAVYAVDGVSFSIAPGETLGLVGESGCGKSTVGRTLLRLLTPTAGSILLGGDDITHLGNRALRPYRRRLQIIFQDPFSSLDPRMTAGAIVGELLEVHGAAVDGVTRKLSRLEREARVAELFARVGLRADQMTHYPHEFSGGQRQRLGIARALSLNPEVIICDEPVSALDVSIQAQVINLLADLQQEYGLAYLFIAHDLAVVEHISDRVAVMYLGRIVEIADRADLFANPQHPYTESLLNAVPIPDPSMRRERLILEGDVPSPIDRPSGCHFHTRCPYAEPRCRDEAPTLKPTERDGHAVACHLR